MIAIFSQSVSLTKYVIFSVCLPAFLSVPVSFLVVARSFSKATLKVIFNIAAGKSVFFNKLMLLAVWLFWPHLNNFKLDFSCVKQIWAPQEFAF